MAQRIDFRFRDRVLSEPINERFSDITGACVLFGFRLSLGSASFTLSLKRDIYPASIAIMPSGAKVEETADILNILAFSPNPHATLARKDSVYLVYTHGVPEAIATYVVVPGLSNSSLPADNPNPTTHLLLGYVNVPPGSASITASSLQSVPYGFSRLRVAGKSEFSDEATFHKPVVFNAPVTFMDGSNNSGGGKSILDRMPEIIYAAAGQTVVNLPNGMTYAANTKSLFVFVDWVPQPPGSFTETSNSAFTFNSPLHGGEKIWAYWITNLAITQVAPHNHDESYYTKSQIDKRSLRYFQDFFVGMTGKVITHNFGNINYIVQAITPTSQTTDAGTISVVKANNTITIYNSGAYRGGFDLTLLQKY